MVLDRAAVSPFSSIFDRDGLCLPEPLAGALFSASSDRQAYAILDAARFFGLVQMLEASRLPHRTLLPETASDEDESDCDDVAPYLVQLDAGNRFVRNLFTRMSHPAALWDSLSGVMGRADSGGCHGHSRGGGAPCPRAAFAPDDARPLGAGLSCTAGKEAAGQ